MKIVFCVLFALLLSTTPTAHAAERSEFVIDNDVWVWFFDVPSRRFRSTREAFIRRDWETARRDLASSAAFVRAEQSRADEPLVEPLDRLAGRLEDLSRTIGDGTVTTSDLDNAFGRAHWLLAQHYLLVAERLRTAGDHRNVGGYLNATCHHLERAVLWSDARLSRSQTRIFDDLRGLATELRSAKDPSLVYRNRPVARARELLLELAEDLDRDVAF